MYTIKPIRTDSDYQAALRRAAILQAQPGELEFDELAVLTTLIGAYETRHYHIPQSAFPDASPQEVWVFHGAGGRFTSGVFVSRTQAEAFINHYRLTGILTKYPVGISAYDWAIANGLFTVKKPEHLGVDFIQRFTTASQEHYHYDPDEIG